MVILTQGEYPGITLFCHIALSNTRWTKNSQNLKATNTASLDSCTYTSSDTNTFNLGDSVEILCDTINLQYAENNNNRNEPMCNKLPFLNNMFITPWEDCSHFKEKWLQDIQKYQGKFVAKMLLTKE